MSRAKILASLDFIEESFLDRDEAAPSAKTLRKWRREAPADAGFALLADAGVFARGAAGQAALENLGSAADALEPEVILFRPPPAHAPSQANRDTLREVLASETMTQIEGARVLWPRGLWDLDVCKGLAAELGMLLAFDPLGNDPLEEIPEVLAQAIEEGSAYLRIDRVGTPRRRLDPFELETLADIVVELERCWVSFAHGERVRDAVALKKLVAEISDDDGTP